MSTLNTSGEESSECPLCMEPLEMDDLSFYPCTCGYQVCLLLFTYPYKIMQHQKYCVCTVVYSYLHVLFALKVPLKSSAIHNFLSFAFIDLSFLLASDKD